MATSIFDITITLVTVTLVDTVMVMVSSIVNITITMFFQVTITSVMVSQFTIAASNCRRELLGLEKSEKSIIIVASSRWLSAVRSEKVGWSNSSLRA